MVAIFRFALPTRKEWSAAEQAEFVRTAAILRGTGLPIVCETGVSDEGDPWVIFLREDTGDVIAHIAKIDGQVMAASAATGDVVCGPSFRTVMDKVVRSQPLVLPASSIGDRIHLHPSAVIVAFIATALAWSLEDDARLYDWKVDADGTIALAGGGRDSSGNVLRDSLFSKAEASRLGLDTGHQQLSHSLVIAAALAAVAIAVKSMDLMLGDETSRVAALPDNTDRTQTVAHHDSNALPGDPQAVASDVAVTHGVLDGEGNALDLAHADQDRMLWQMPAVAIGLAAQNIKLLFDAGRPAELPDLPSLHIGKPSLVDGLIESVNLRSLPPISEVPTDGAPNPVIVVAQRNEVATAEKAETEVVHAVTSAPQPQASSLAPHVGPSSEPFKFSADWRGLFLHDELHTSQSVTVAGPVVSLDVVEPTAAPEATSTASNTGPSYELIVGSILSFANNSRNELTASPGAIKPLQQALDSLKAYLPDPHLILIVDVPGDRNANVWKFEKGVTMMAYETAEKLLPSFAFHVMQEILLPNGEMLKLMGVVDLHDYPAYA